MGDSQGKPEENKINMSLLCYRQLAVWPSRL